MYTFNILAFFDPVTIDIKTKYFERVHFIPLLFILLADIHWVSFQHISRIVH